MQTDITLGPCRLICGDCLDVLPTLPEADQFITDPPYAEKTHKFAQTNKGGAGAVKLIHFGCLTDEAFSAAVAMMLSRCREWLVMTCDYRHAPLCYHLPEWVRLGAWVKPNPMPQISADRPGQGFEMVAINNRPRAIISETTFLSCRSQQRQPLAHSANPKDARGYPLRSGLASAKMTKAMNSAPLAVLRSITARMASALIGKPPRLTKLQNPCRGCCLFTMPVILRSAEVVKCSGHPVFRGLPLTGSARFFHFPLAVITPERKRDTL